MFASSKAGFVNDVIVQKGGGVYEFNNDGELYGRGGRGVFTRFRTEKDQERPNSFASVFQYMVNDEVDKGDSGIQLFYNKVVELFYVRGYGGLDGL